MHADLNDRDSGVRRELMALLVEQRRTNRLLETAVFGGMGFALGLLVMLALVRHNIF